MAILQQVGLLPAIDAAILVARDGLSFLSPSTADRERERYCDPHATRSRQSLTAVVVVGGGAMKKRATREIMR